MLRLHHSPNTPTPRRPCWLFPLLLLLWAGTPTTLLAQTDTSPAPTTRPASTVPPATSRPTKATPTRTQPTKKKALAKERPAKKKATTEEKRTRAAPSPKLAPAAGVSTGEKDKPSARRSGTSKTKRNKHQRLSWWRSDLSLGGVIGQWGSSPLFGLQGTLPLSRHIGLRFSWVFQFYLEQDPKISFSTFSLGMLIRLPSPIRLIRHYAITRVDFWPLWNIFNTNPNVRQISDQPALGLSVLLGLELFFIQGLSFFLETGFSTGMVLSLGTIQRQNSFGFVLLSGLQAYF